MNGSCQKLLFYYYMCKFASSRPSTQTEWPCKRLVRQVTKTHMNTLKEVKASAAKMGETLHTATVALVLHQSELYVEWQRESHWWRKLISSPKPCVRLQGQLEEGSLVRWDQNGALQALDVIAWLRPITPHRLSAALAARAASNQHWLEGGEYLCNHLFYIIYFNLLI